MLLDPKPPHNRTGRHRILAMGIVVCGMAILAGSNLSVAEPIGGTVSTVNQSTPTHNIDWKSYNVGVGESLNYTQPSAPSMTVNPVHNGRISIRGSDSDILYKYKNGGLSLKPGSMRRSSGKSYRFDLRGDGLITFSVDANEAADLAGGSDALGLTSVGAPAMSLTSGAVSRMLPAVVNMDGVVDAGIFSTSPSGGSVLVAPPGVTLRP